ncbi:hypothetical protein OC846_001022 [Tilletia horrida]|uniref:WD40 repeat-like protein n=1 Tax=Tilletia horrida TaxID=155126 RepID=A0AAN6GTC3_9BASI|nr:hypothetical protein OC845_000348 [Tilletia horrida]KAK0556578.1 hypothetical protein OC846_001022 [Tilletia horrida]
MNTGFAPDYLHIKGGKAAVSALTSPPPGLTLEVPRRPYITHLLPLTALPAPLIVFGTSTEDVLNVLNSARPEVETMHRLVWRSTSSSSRSEQTAISGLIAAPPAAPSQASLYTPSTNGKIAIWDLRSQALAPVGELVGQGAPAPQFERGAGSANKPAPANGPAYLCAAASEDGYTLAAGTELRGTDAIIDIWDIRKPSEPLFSYCESHSDDVSSLAFCPSSAEGYAGPSSSAGSSCSPRTAILLSGSTDGLMSIFNTSVAQGDEDDAVVRVQNIGASVAKVGWGGIASSLVRHDGMEVELDEDEAAKAIAARTPRGLGGAWGVTDMQTMSVFDADNFDFTTLAGFPTRSRTSLMPAYEPDYVIDILAGSRLPSQDQGTALSLWTGDPTGNFALTSIPPAEVVGEAQEAGSASRKAAEPWELVAFFPAGRNAHEDIVRCVHYDRQLHSLITGGEDGRICFWHMPDGDGEAVSQTPISAIQAIPPAAGPGQARHITFDAEETATLASAQHGGPSPTSLFRGGAARERATDVLVKGSMRGPASGGSKVRYRPF